MSHSPMRNDNLRKRLARGLGQLSHWTQFQNNLEPVTRTAPAKLIISRQAAQSGSSCMIDAGAVFACMSSDIFFM